ncbi:uncharacterized protein LOC126671387 [Mercurialis annua]|uniref:uncharacterized protein LOC126671387 n=1 Tax=Mercurialis annua TaxID=3986 RepID=UPI00215F8A70|nr:uncharacterized protein LOC126671387 [Mercurialis annua]
MDEWKRSGQIPAFGNWEHANEMPITQYFECARQAGLIRYSNSSGECDRHGSRGCGGGGAGDLYAANNFKKASRDLGPPRKTRVSRERNRVVSSSGGHVKEQKKQGKVCDVTQPPTKQHQHQHQPMNGGGTVNHRPKFPAKAVDEDLYKIPPELLRSSKRKKMPGFFSCLVPACAS